MKSADPAMTHLSEFISSADGRDWPAPGSEDTKLGVLMEREVRHGAAEVYAGIQT